MWYSAFLLTLSVVLLSADQNLAAPHMSDIAEDFFREACKSDFPGGEKEQDECVEHRKLHQLGGEAQFGFFILGGLSTIVIGPMADVYPRVRLLVTVIWTGALPCLLTLFIPNGVFGFYCFMTQRVLTGISVGGSFPVIYSVLADIFPPTYKAFIGTIVASGTAAGVGLGTFASGIIGSQTGWRFVFCVVAAPSIVLSLFALGTVIEPKRERVLQHGSKSTLGDDEPLTGGAASAGVVRSSAGPTTSDRSIISATRSRPSGPASTTSQASSDSAVPEIFLFLLAVLAGCGAVTGPTVKGLLLNVNDSQIRGTVTGLVTLTDDVGKGFAPIVVAHYMQLFGKGYAIGKALDCFLLCAFVNFLTFFTITDDFIHFGRYTDENEANDAALGGGPEEVLHLGEESGGAAPARPGSSGRVGPTGTGGGPGWHGTAGVAGQLSRELGDTPLGRTNFNH
eukprot:g8774.t1